MTILNPTESLLTPFMLEGGHVRGRITRLGAVANTILTRYDYPPVVAHLLGELLAVASLLSSSLKQEGILTIQIRGNGPVPLIVVDATYGGALRGYADVPAEAAEALSRMEQCAPKELVGDNAYLAITLDPGEGMQRYQGIVGLEGNSIAEALGHYFLHSNQLDAAVVLAVSTTPPNVAGMLIERMPQTSEAAQEENQEAWRYAKAILGTVKQEELLSPLLNAEDMLYRLFHEEGVRVYPSQTVHVGCRCSRERIENLLLSMSLEDRAEMVVEGKVNVHCQFCNKDEVFAPVEIGLTVN